MGRARRRAMRDFLVAGAMLVAMVGISNLPLNWVSAATSFQQGVGEQEIWVEELAAGLNHPWSMTWLPNQDLLITERFGGVRRFRSGRLEPEALAGTPAAYQAGQSGLLDIALDPDFATTRRIFLSYTEGSVQANRGAIWRARYTDKGFVEGRTIYRIVPDARKFPFPVAGRILFLPDKTFLFTSSDDHERRALVQRLDNDVGKILRLDRDGRAAANNPFHGRDGARAEIYALGVRGPLGLVMDPRDGKVWETENGPRGGDELNVVKAGANYGWPIATYGVEYSGKTITEVRQAAGLESPAAYWVPSISPSGLAFNLGNRYPMWKGDLFSGALSGKHLRRIRINGGKVVDQEVLLSDLNERIRDVRMGPDGYLYLLTDSPNGRLLRLRPGRPRGVELARVARPISEEIATSILMAMASPPAALPGDAGRGEEAFSQRCAGCHGSEPEAQPGIGPNLAGLMGRRAGAGNSEASEALRRTGLVWNAAHLDGFLAAPQAKIPGTTMSTAPIRNSQERADIIAFLMTLRAR